MKVTYENNWDHTEIHIDLPVPYEENYQIHMLNHNRIPCLCQVKGSGRDGYSRYTFHVRNCVSMEKKYEKTDMKKEEIEDFIRSFTETVRTWREYMLNPDCLLLTPELVFLSERGYRFCYLPAVSREWKKPVSRSFHEMTEYFVKKLDYQDTDGVFLVYKIHRETMKDSYDLRKIMEEWKEERKKNDLPDTAVFSAAEEEREEEEVLKSQKEKQESAEQTPNFKEIRDRETKDRKIKESTIKYGSLKKAIRRIKTGQWGIWDDLITEMDGHDSTGHL